MTWAQRLKRVFNIDIEVCDHCGGSVRVIACIEEQDVMPDKAGQALDRILAHLREKEQNIPTHPLERNFFHMLLFMYRYFISQRRKRKYPSRGLTSPGTTASWRRITVGAGGSLWLGVARR